METPAEIVSRAIEEHDPAACFVGFSGGKDSLAVAHLMMALFPDRFQVLHCNTGIGIERTREFVRQTSAAYGWPFVEIHAKHDCGQDYEQLCLKYGFPGPNFHGIMYDKLKERSIDKLVRENKRHRRDRILIATGLRRQESWRRMHYTREIIDRRKSQVWVNPIYHWSASQRDQYIEEHNLPVNPVSSVLGMSGECLCGCYSHKGQKELVRLACPRTAAYLDELEEKVKAAGWTWGWDEEPPRKTKKKSGTSTAERKRRRRVLRDRAGPHLFCVGCEKGEEE